MKLVEAENVGIVTEDLLNRMIEMGSTLTEVRLNPETKVVESLVGVRVYRGFVIVYDTEYPVGKVSVRSEG